MKLLVSVSVKFPETGSQRNKSSLSQVCVNSFGLFSGRVNGDQVSQSVKSTVLDLNQRPMDVVAVMSADSNMLGATTILFQSSLIREFVRHPNLKHLMVLEQHAGASGSFIKVLLDAASNVTGLEVPVFKTVQQFEAYLAGIYGPLPKQT